MEATQILGFLAEREAVLTGSHFVYTSQSNHGTAYINMRQVAQEAGFMSSVGYDLAVRLKSFQPDIVLGPETLGRTLADHVGPSLDCQAIWCDIVEQKDGSKKAVFSEKLNFTRLLPGKRLVVVDDLLTTGGSIFAAVTAAREGGADVVGAACVVRRTPDVGASECGVPKLEVLAEVQGFEVMSPEECNERGPCSQHAPIVRRPGHGWKWEETHPDYAGGYIDTPN